MPGYRLHQSSRLASFAESLPELFLAEDPLAPPVFTVVQNAGLGEWLTRKLAAVRGAVMAPRILLPEQALRRFAMEYPGAASFCAQDGGGTDTDGKKSRGLLFMDGMKLVMYKALEESLGSGESVYDPLRTYAGGGEERLWQLCDALAGLFYSYGMNCPPLIRCWESGGIYGEAAAVDAEAEAWQRGLWRRIFRDNSPYAHLSGLLTSIMESGESYGGPTGRIVLFGSMFLGETGLRFFRYLANDLDVDHFILAPSKTWAEGGSSTLPFLENNGGLSRGFGALAPSLKPDETVFVRENPGRPESLLHRLRSSIIDDEPLSGAADPDGSLAFHDVSGARRSVEVLKDRILEALRDDPSLAPTQIGVLAPDISLYAPYIETVFPSRSGPFAPDHLSFNIADLPVGTEAPYPSAFRALTELPGSRFGRGAVMDLLENPCFAPVARNSDLAADWMRMIADLNVRWGLDARHRAENGAADARIGSWRTAFDRLLDGYCRDEGDDSGLLPAYLAGDGDAEAAGVLMRTLDDLESDFRGLEKNKLPVREWCLRWESLVERWIVPRSGDEGEGDESDRMAAKKTIRDLMTVCDDVDDLSDFDDGLLPWSAFSSLLGETAESASRKRGRYLARGVTCASLKPMRAIPFRRIYVLGLDEGAWPKHERTPGFDFRDRVPKTIDLSRESVDRFALLETIFSAEEHLSLFYCGRDTERGDETAPASPLLELLDHLGPGAGGLVTRHPLNAFDAMTGEGPAASSSRQALELALVRTHGLRFPDPAPSLLPMSDEETVDWRELVLFLKNPVEYFFRRRLGAALDSREEDRSDGDVLEASRLDWWKWRDSHISEDPAMLRRPAEFVDGFLERLSAEGIVADSAARGLQEEDWKEEAASMAEQLERLVEEGLDLGEPFACRFDAGLPAAESSDAAEAADAVRSGRAAIAAAGALEAPDATAAGLPLIVRAPAVSPEGVPPATVTGIVDGLRLLNGPDGPDGSVWTLLEFVSSKSLRTDHVLGSWAAAVVLGAALGERRPRELRVFRLGSRDFSARRYYYSAGDLPPGSGGERVVLESPEALLESLVRAYRAGSAEPLALYPEMADRMLKAGAGRDSGGGTGGSDGGRAASMRQDDTAGSLLPGAARRAWNEILSDTRSPFSRLRDCPWRHRFLAEPDFGGDAFRRAWEELYLRGILA